MTQQSKKGRRDFLKTAAITTVASGLLTTGSSQVAIAKEKRRDRTGRQLKVIDFRCRPPITPQKLLFDVKLGRQKWKNQMICPPFNDVSPSMLEVGKKKGLQLLLQEMNESGVDQIVMPGRNLLNMPKAAKAFSDTDSINVTDEMLLDLISSFDNRATGLHGIDLSDISQATVNIENAVRKHGMPGAVLEAGYHTTGTGAPMQLDNKTLYPIYETMVSTDSVLMIQSGIYAGFDIGANDWPPLDQVLQDFPTLKVVLAHGGYPRVMDALALATKHPNFYLSPDIYCFFPGGSLYVESISMLPDQFLFGSAYPFGSLQASVDESLRFDLPDDVMEKYMGGNAARLLSFK